MPTTRAHRALGTAFFDHIRRLDTIPCVNETLATEIIAEIGTDMEQFPNQHHLASWTGVCSGNNLNAGKHKGGKTTQRQPLAAGHAR